MQVPSADGPDAGRARQGTVTAQQPDFACYAAHELRTPLATQRALLELTLADPGADVASWREVGEDVLGACRHQERLLDACLALARSRDGLQAREAIDLAGVAADALRAHDAGALGCAAQLAPATTSGDPDMLERLAANLVSNAIRHNVAGGRFAVATRTERGRAVLSVANTGVRIPAGELDRLFQPFRRFGAAGGVGLGLTLVREIAEAHDAVIAARALTGGGLEIDVAFVAWSADATGD